VWAAGVVIGMLGLSYAFVPLYRMFCQATGYAGTANESDRGGGEALQSLTAVAGSRILTIEFTSDVSPNLSWNFEPMQRVVRVQPGETTLAFYNATNDQDEAVTGISTYNVSPQKAGLYFHKIQCFCFEEQRLLAGETIDMPVFFYIDPDFADDPKVCPCRNNRFSLVSIDHCYD
jgi:cytochrome c oxidase assembly protein subunit 11